MYLQQLSLAIIIICMTMHYVLVHTYIHIYHSVYVHMQHIRILVSMCIYLCLAVCSYVECVCLIVCMLQCAQMYACDLCVYNVYMYAHANFSFALLHCSYIKCLCYTFIEKLTSVSILLSALSWTNILIIHIAIMLLLKLTYLV